MVRIDDDVVPEYETLPWVNGSRNMDIDKLLADKYGERYRFYRREYHDSLNYQSGFQVPDFPLYIGLELVNRCNLSCVMCYTINHKNPKYTLTPELTEKIMTECQEHAMPSIGIGMHSEAFVHKGALDVIKAAVDADIMDLWISTNGVLLTEEVADFLVEQQIPRLLVSLDAATPDTYTKIRGKNELETIEKNLDYLLRKKETAGSQLPILRVSFCVQDENKNEVDSFMKKWKDRADWVDLQEIYDVQYVDEVDEDGAKTEEAAQLVPDRVHCAYPFHRLGVVSNGDVTPCCSFYGMNLVLGNVENESLEEIWKGEKINRIRNELITGNLNPVCKACLGARDDSRMSEASDAIDQNG